jgi:glycosyltransferase involved in cell wall biosynthesis
MKILLVSYYPLPHLGGIWTFVSHLKERLVRLGHQVDILSHNPETTKYRMIGRKSDLSISHLAPMIEEKLKQVSPDMQENIWIYNTEIFRYSLELSSLYYDLSSYDIIHAQDVIAAGAISRIKPPNTPLVTSAHGYLTKEIYYVLKSIYPKKTDRELRESFEYRYHHMLEYKGYFSSDLIHSQSNWMRSNIINLFSIPDSKVITFPYGMDIEEFLNRFQDTKKREKISRPANKKIILFMGRLAYLKGVHHLIGALSLLKQYRTDWECWILGEGFQEVEEELRDQCETLDLEDEIKFLGTRENVADFLKLADIFVLPSLQDTQPHSVMEAQLSGKPVIVSDAAGLPEMVENGTNGLIFPTGEVQELSNQINYLLDNKPLRNQFAKNAKEWAEERWSLDKMVGNVLSLYHHALQMKGNGS